MEGLNLTYITKVYMGVQAKNVKVQEKIESNIRERYMSEQTRKRGKLDENTWRQWEKMRHRERKKEIKKAEWRETSVSTYQKGGREREGSEERGDDKTTRHQHQSGSEETKLGSNIKALNKGHQRRRHKLEWQQRHRHVCVYVCEYF